MIGLVGTAFGIGERDYGAGHISHSEYLINTLIHSIKYCGLGPARKDLQKRSINIEALEIMHYGYQSGSLRDVFHPSAMYSLIEQKSLVHTPHCLHVAGFRNGFFKKIPFDLIFGYINPMEETIGGERSRNPMEGVENYLIQRQEAQQPEYVYTYRTRQEVKK